MTLQRFYAVSSAAVLAACFSGCAASRAGSVSSPSALPSQSLSPLSMVPMNLDIVGDDAKGVLFHHYWLYSSDPVQCNKGDTTAYASQIQGAILTVNGHAAEPYAMLYLVRCKSGRSAQKTASVAAALPLPLIVDIVGNDVASGVVGHKFDRHLLLDKAAVACDPAETPVPEPGSGKPGQRVGDATVTFTFQGQTRSYRGSYAYFMRCSKENPSAPMLRR